MSFTASDYAWRLRVHGKSTPRKMMLIRIAAMVSDDNKSCFAKTGTFAAYLDIDARNAKAYISDLIADGHISVLDRTHPDGQQRESRFFMHGPWDAFGGTGVPFVEIDLPKSSKPLDPTSPIEVTPETRDELRRRYNEYAEEFGNFPDGAPRCRWRLGCRAHSIVCWYGVGNEVAHDGRRARVISITDVGPRNKPIPEQVTLTYLDEEGGTSKGVLVEDLLEPTEAPQPNPSEPQNPSSEGGGEIAIPGVVKSPPHGVVKSPPHGVVKSPPHESSSEPKVESSSSGSTPDPREEDEESPSARKTSGVRPVDLISAETDATEDEASALWELLRPLVKSSPGGLIRHMAKNGDLTYQLDDLRRQRAPQARTEATGGRRITSQGSCVWHSAPAPCQACRIDLNAGGVDAQEILDLYAALGSDAAQQRPDLAAHPAIAALSGAH